MNKLAGILMAAAGLTLGTAQADELLMPQAASAVTAEAETASAVATEPLAADAPAAATVAMPQKGQTMAAVLKAFGEPQRKHKPAGGDTPRQPAITRWDYEGFSVFFEKGLVISGVNPADPSPLQHTDKLKPLEY